MNFIKEPMAIENRSMELIAPHLAELHLDERATKLYSRLIHASGDVGYAPITRVHPEAIDRAIEALKAGAHIYTDVEMVRTGINKKKLASFVAMRKFGKDLDGSIVAIGNAPTALFEVLRLVREEGIRPACIVGIPVGFVGAAESKAELAENGIVPYITVEGTKGGSPIAAAAINALMYIIDNTRP